MAEKTGDRYCNVEAAARGICCKSIKKEDRAIAPATPLKISIFLLLPQTEIPLDIKIVPLMTKDIIDRNKIISIGGMLGIDFTNTFINVKMKVANNIYLTPFVIIGDQCFKEASTRESCHLSSQFFYLPCLPILRCG